MNNWLKFAVIAIIGTLIGSVIVAALQYKAYEHPTDATVVEFTVARYFNGSLLADNESIHWGDAYAGYDHLAPLNVQNIGDYNTTVWVTSPNLPINWTVSWTANNTLLIPDAWANGTITLYVDPTNAVENQTYNWETIIHAEES